MKVTFKWEWFELSGWSLFYFLSDHKIISVNTHDRLRMTKSYLCQLLLCLHIWKKWEPNIKWTILHTFLKHRYLSFRFIFRVMQETSRVGWSTELSAVMKISCICTVEYDSHVWLLSAWNSLFVIKEVNF